MPHSLLALMAGITKFGLLQTIEDYRKGEAMNSMGQNTNRRLEVHHSIQPSGRFQKTVGTVLIVIFITITANAQNVEKNINLLTSQDLIKQTSRPTMKDIWHLVSSRYSIFDSFRYNVGLLKDVSKLGAPMIAEINSIFPNATFAFLGRDTSVAADIFEAYFISIGQGGRVVRLNASAESFSTHGQEIAFLKSNGLRLDDEGIPEKPFIILDATSWEMNADGATSQARRLVGAVYAQVEPEKRSKLPKLINAIGLGPKSGSLQNGSTIEPNLDVDKFFSNLKLDENGPSQILYSVDRFSYITNFWHDPFGPFETNASGLTYAPPGELTPRKSRQFILDSMIRIGRIAGSVAFKNKVQESSLAFQQTHTAESSNEKHLLLQSNKLVDLNLIPTQPTGDSKTEAHTPGEIAAIFNKLPVNERRIFLEQILVPGLQPGKFLNLLFNLNNEVEAASGQIPRKGAELKQIPEKALLDEIFNNFDLVLRFDPNLTVISRSFIYRFKGQEHYVAGLMATLVSSQLPDKEVNRIFKWIYDNSGIFHYRPSKDFLPVLDQFRAVADSTAKASFGFELIKTFKHPSQGVPSFKIIEPYLDKFSSAQLVVLSQQLFALSWIEKPFGGDIKVFAESDEAVKSYLRLQSLALEKATSVNEFFELATSKHYLKEILVLKDASFKLTVIEKLQKFFALGGDVKSAIQIGEKLKFDAQSRTPEKEGAKSMRLKPAFARVVLANATTADELMQVYNSYGDKPVKLKFFGGRNFSPLSDHEFAARIKQLYLQGSNKNELEQISKLINNGRFSPERNGNGHINSDSIPLPKSLQLNTVTPHSCAAALKD